MDLFALLAENSVFQSTDDLNEQGAFKAINKRNISSVGKRWAKIERFLSRP